MPPGEEKRRIYKFCVYLCAACSSGKGVYNNEQDEKERRLLHKHEDTTNWVGWIDSVETLQISCAISSYQ